jgi:putative aldouronate transport system permease protein
MLFNGGLVPSYLMWTRVFNIKNTILALIIPGLLMNAFNVLLMKNFFSTNIPKELIEAAQIDSAGEFRIFLKIILPLSLPIMATIGLFTGLAYWNDWINGLYYVTDSSLFSIQVLLSRILSDIQFLLSRTTSNGVNTSNISSIPSVSIRMAIAVLGIIPIMIIFPFFQKYFVKGMTVGSVKG